MQTKTAVFASHIYYAQDKMLIEQHDKKKNKKTCINTCAYSLSYQEKTLTFQVKDKCIADKKKKKIQVEMSLEL